MRLCFLLPVAVGRSPACSGVLGARERSEGLEEETFFEAIRPKGCSSGGPGHFLRGMIHFGEIELRGLTYMHGQNKKFHITQLTAVILRGNAGSSDRG